MTMGTDLEQDGAAGERAAAAPVRFEFYAIDAASYALAMGVPLLECLLAEDGEHVRYILDDSDGQARAALFDYRSGTAQVEPQSFMRAYRRLAEARRVKQGEVRQRLIRERQARWSGYEYKVGEGTHTDEQHDAA